MAGVYSIRPLFPQSTTSKMARPFDVGNSINGIKKNEWSYFNY